MNKNAVICAIEHALKNDGCNEIMVSELYERVARTRGNFKLTMGEFISVLEELERDGLFESILGEEAEISAQSLVARSQMHPSVPHNDTQDAIRL
jgi:hypothetical protein